MTDRGAGPPLVLVPGIQGRWEWMAPAVDALAGKSAADPSFANTCYSLVAPEYGISVAKVYAWQGGKLVGVKGSGGVSPKGASARFRAEEARYASGWYAAIAADIWG